MGSGDAGRGMGLGSQQKKDLPPDDYIGHYACAMCIKPAQTLLPGHPGAYLTEPGASRRKEEPRLIYPWI